MYSHSVILVKRKVGYDDLGNPTTVKTETEVLCKLRSVGTNEFYQASAQGLKPDIEFVLHGFEYNGETTVLFEGREYNVIRTYRPNYEEVELTCERVISNE